MYIHDGPPLYVTADRSEAVEEGDERAAFLLVGPGGQLTDEEAEKYGLKAKAKAAANKAKTSAPENKAEGGDAEPSAQSSQAPGEAVVKEEVSDVTFTNEPDGPKAKRGR